MSTETKNYSHLTIQQMNDEYLRLQNVIADRDSKIEELSDELDNTKYKLKSSYDIIEQKNERIESLSEDVDKLEFRVEDYESTKQDNAEDCRRSLFFALEELKEVQDGRMTVDEKVRELTSRYCRFI